MGTTQSVPQTAQSDLTLKSKAPPVLPYQFLQKTYHSLYGDIILIKNVKKNQQMVVKEILSTSLQDHNSQLRRTNYMQELKHPNLLEVSYISADEKEIFSNCYKLHQMFEYHSLDLHTDLKLKKIHSQCFYSEDEILEFLKQMVSALAFLQSKGVIHGGVNVYSIVIDQCENKLFCKIIPPFGLKGHDNYEQVINLGPLAQGIYVSPRQMENLKDKRQPSPLFNGYKSDVFSLGCIALSMIRNVEIDSLFDYIKFVFESDAFHLILFNLKNQVKNPFLVNMIRWMLELEEEKRCDFMDLDKLLKNGLIPKKLDFDKENVQVGLHPPQQKHKPMNNLPLSSKEIIEETLENLEEDVPNVQIVSKNLPSIALPTLETESKPIYHSLQESENPTKSISVPLQEKANSLNSQEIKPTPLPIIGEIKLESVPQGSKSCASSYVNPQVLQILNEYHSQRKRLETANNNDLNNVQELKPTDQSLSMTHPENAAMKQIVVNEDFSNGERYDGDMIENKKQGKGKYTYADGGIYEGEWNDDKREGFGTLYYSNKCVAYYGEWIKDKFHGKGALYNKLPGALKGFDGKDLNKIGDGWNKYEGEFVFDLKEGKGEVSLMNGGVFIGEFQENLAYGKGIYRKANGEEMMGKWRSGIYQEI